MILIQRIQVSMTVIYSYKIMYKLLRSGWCVLVTIKFKFPVRVIWNTEGNARLTTEPLKAFSEIYIYVNHLKTFVLIVGSLQSDLRISTAGKHHFKT